MGVGTDYTSTESTDAGSIVQVIKQLHPVEFTDSSTGADSVLWNFGDGDTSTERNPTHNYSSNGTFVVTLTAYNQFGEDSTTQTVVVSGIGVDSYEVEQPTEEETTEEVVEEETTEEDSTFQTQGVQNTDIFEMPELTLDKDDEDEDKDYGYEGDFSLDAGSTSSDDTEDTTTQQTTEEQQGRMVELVFQPFSPDGMSMFGMETKDLELVNGELELLQVGTPIKIIGNESKRLHNRQVAFIIDDGKTRGIMIDVEIEVEDNFYNVQAEV
jgi:hypothetical protein